MSKFKIGDKVVVVNADSIYDNYFNGDIGTVVAYDLNPETAGYVQRKDGFVMNVYWTEIKHLEENKEMTAEQIRDEILRIDARIEEAKKDIENAEKERNFLVEKLREKGFEIVLTQPILKDIISLDEVVIGETYIVTNNFGEAEDRFVGKRSIVREIDYNADTLFVYINAEDGSGNDWMHYKDLAKI